MTKYSLTKSNLCSAPTGRLSKAKKPILGVFLMVLLVGALSIYLLEVNNIAAKGYEIRNLEQQVDEIEAENEKLSVRVIELKSMNELDEKVASLDMVPVGDMKYYDSMDQVVARR
jgi:cell division protein FtsL